MKHHYFLFIVLIICSVNLEAQQYVWTQKANYGGGEVYDAFSFAIGTKGYAGSGYVEPRVYQQNFWEWDQAINVWTQKANFPGAGREGSRGFSIGNMGYVTCGYTPSMFLNDLWQYDPTANTWTQKTSFPGSSRYLGTTFSLYNKGYFGLGPGSSYFNDFWEYDPVSDSWTQKASFTGTARGAASRFVINNEAYVGIGSNVSLNQNYTDFYKYDPIANSWTRIADFPGPGRNGAYSFTIADSGYIVCGYDGLSYVTAIFQDFYRYDPSTNSWAQLADFPGKKIFEGIYFEIGVRGYIGVGCDVTDFSHLQKEFWEYGPVSNPPVASFQSSDSTICAYSCINFIDKSTNATSWNWSFQGATPSSSTDQNPQNICYPTGGSYDVTLIASNVGGNDTLTIPNYIKVHPAPPTPVINHTNDSLICTTDPSFTSFQWYYNDTIIPGATNTFYVETQNGNYNIAVTDTNGCKISVGIIILGLNEMKGNVTFSLYPNPVNNELTISFPKAFDNAEIEINDAIGRNLIQRKFDSLRDNKINIDVSNLAEGTYFVSINIDGRKWTKRVIKNLGFK